MRRPVAEAAASKLLVDTGWNCLCTVVQVLKGKYQETDHNPYTISRCKNCPKTQGNLASGVPDNQLCEACGIVRARNNILGVGEIKSVAKKSIQGITIENQNFPHKVTITERSIKEWLNQPHKYFDDKNKLLLKIQEVFQNSSYKGVSHFKEIPAHIFEITLCGEKSWIVVREYPDGFRLHSISDSLNILKDTK